MMRLFVLLALCGAARADVSAGASRQEGAAARRLLAPWRECAALKDAIPFDDELWHVAAKPTPEGLEAFVWDEGSGRDAVGSWFTLRLTRGQCDARGWETAGPKEWIESGLRRVAKGGAALPTLTEIAAWSNAQLVSDANRDELAAARLLVRLSADEDHQWHAQPEHAGRPHGSPAAIWTPELLQAAGIEHPWLDDDEGKLDALYHGRVREPRLLVAKGNFEIWELRWRARNGGGMVAVYDRAHDRHRWLWGTHEDRRWNGAGEPDAKSFLVERFEDGKLILRIKPDQVTRRVSIDLRTGAIQEDQ